MYEEQVAWAKEAGVDFVVAETISWTDEMKIALKAIKALIYPFFNFLKMKLFFY